MLRSRRVGIFTTTVALRLLGVATGTTALGLVGETFGSEELLLSGGEGEGCPAVGTLD